MINPFTWVFFAIEFDSLPFCQIHGQGHLCYGLREEESHCELLILKDYGEEGRVQFSLDLVLSRVNTITYKL